MIMTMINYSNFIESSLDTSCLDTSFTPDLKQLVYSFLPPLLFNILFHIFFFFPTLSLFVAFVLLTVYRFGMHGNFPL